jgi:hypothetical protein
LPASKNLHRSRHSLECRVASIRPTTIDGCRHAEIGEAKPISILRYLIFLLNFLHSQPYTIQSDGRRMEYDR